MNDDLSTVPKAQLERAQREDGARRHRRRMLITGLAGVTAAALALGAGVYLLSQPDSDPLAIFERDETQLDRDGLAWLVSSGFATHFTAGPRAIEVDDGYVIIAARLSTVADGRSTEWDSYCLYVVSPGQNDGPRGVPAACTYPEQFERDGITVPARPSASGEGLDAAIWGPTGEPQLRNNVPPNWHSDQVPSVLDWLSNPTFLSSGVASGGLIDDSDRLLMGPAHVSLQGVGADMSASEGSALQTTVLLLRGERPTDSPLLCVHVEAVDGTSRMPCTPLPTARREGVEVPFTFEGRSWLITIEPDGRNRSDTVRLLDE